MQLVSATDTLNAGETLDTGTVLFSRNNDYFAFIGWDCNFVIKRSNNEHHIVWQTYTAKSYYDFNCRLALQKGDGNLVVYDGSGKALWATHKYGGDRLVMQNDGNLVVYDGGKAIWASNTVGK